MYLLLGVQTDTWTHSRKPSSLSGVPLPKGTLPQTNKELNTELYTFSRKENVNLENLTKVEMNLEKATLHI